MLTAPPVKDADATKRGRGRPPKRPADPAPPAAPPADFLGVLSAATDAAPAPRGPGRPSTAEKSRTQLASSLAENYRAAGGLLLGVGALGALVPAVKATSDRCAAVGQALMANADRCADALAAWADKNPKVRKALTSVTNGAGLLVVLAAHAPIIAAALGRGGELVQLGADLLAPADPATDDGSTDLLAAMLGGLLKGSTPVATG